MAEVNELAMLRCVSAGRRERTSSNILLVRKHQKERIFHFSVIDNAMQLLSGLVYAVAITRVDNEDQALGAFTSLASISTFDSASLVTYQRNNVSTKV